MQILSVTLTNFKTHQDRHFKFQPGTNAICGENGAGKTSILEAIAWVLFNYRGDYVTADLIRNGTGSAQVMVEFVSSRDGRTYQVLRSTNKGYAIYDPQLDQRLSYSRIEDEILPWLREHMGVAPNVDLGQLFANTIGVPQGTFTADFLKSVSDRKRVFDAILKVEEYEKVFKELNGLRKYAEGQSAAIADRILQYNETLEQWDELQQRQAQAQQELEQNEATLKTLKTQLEQLEAERQKRLAQQQQIQTLKVQLSTLTAQIQGQEQQTIRLDQALQQAKEAVQICEVNRVAYESYQAATDKLKQLEQQIRQRQILWNQREQYRQQMRDRDTDLTRLKLRLEQLATAEQDLTQLKPLIEQQEQLEQQLAEISKALQQLQSIAVQAQAVQQQIQQVSRQLQSVQSEIEQIQRLDAQIQQIPDLEKKRDRIQEQLSRVEAAKQFEAELHQLVSSGQERHDRYQTEAAAALATLKELQSSMPLLAASPVESIAAAIESGVEVTQEMLRSLYGILTDLSAQVSVPQLQQQLRSHQSNLATAYQSKAQAAGLPQKLEQQAALQQEGLRLQQQLAQHQQQLQTEAEQQLQQQAYTQQIQQLGNPKGRSQLLQQQLQQLKPIQQQYAALQTALKDIQTQLNQVEQQIAEFAELDALVEAEKQCQQQQHDGYLRYLQHEKAAQALPSVIQEIEQITVRTTALKAQQVELHTQYDQQMADFDAETLAQLEQTYSATRSQADQITGSLPQQQKLLHELNQQVAALKETAAKRDQAEQERQKRDRTKRFINFARKTYKEAGPRITQLYLHTISREADRLFRELLNRPNVSLDWTQDYEIVVQEGANTRRFTNLSGGEQMCAALAVRLALLKVLADLDIAFFDEPTTNMDRPRRDSLAEAIARIKTFRQIFVISHDDTFEKVTENVIFVERQV
ncbi:MAG: AAA family ATPase [Thainema sp.]